MRFADGPEMSREIHIDATPEAVWDVCTDLSRFGEWSPENRGGTWEAGGPGLGARFHGVNEHKAIGRWETESIVVTYDRPHVFAWAVASAENPAATWTFTLEPDGGGTRLRQHVRMGPGPSGTTRAIDAMPDKEERIVARRLQEYEAGVDAVLAGIRAAVQG